MVPCGYVWLVNDIALPAFVFFFKELNILFDRKNGLAPGKYYQASFPRGGLPGGVGKRWDRQLPVRPKDQISYLSLVNGHDSGTD